MSNDNISKLHKYEKERDIEYRSFLLWAMQAKTRRNIRAVSRAIGKSHTTICNYMDKNKWAERVTSLTDEAEAQQLYKSLYMPEFGHTEITAVQKYIATPISTSGTMSRSMGESVQKAINTTNKQPEKVHEKEVQRKQLMLLDAAIGYIAQGLKAGDKWCLCALRWVEAYNNGCAPKLLLESTNIRTLDFVSLEKLLEYQV